MFGGNSNWRGPIWMPVNMLIVRALLQYYLYYGDRFTIECPTGSGRHMTLYQVAEEISGRLANIFLRDANGRRPVYGGTRKLQEDPHWRDLILFYEYFHGDNGAGLGASHQTGWTGVIARAMHLFATTTAQQALELGKYAGASRRRRRRPRPVAGGLTCPRLPLALSDQHAGAADRAVPDAGQPATLDDIPDAELDRIAALGFDWVWLLSVWRTGSAGQRVSRAHAGWRHEFEDTLPDLCAEDIAGSGSRSPATRRIPQSAAPRRWRAFASGCRRAGSS